MAKSLAIVSKSTAPLPADYAPLRVDAKRTAGMDQWRNKSAEGEPGVNRHLDVAVPETGALRGDGLRRDEGGLVGGRTKTRFAPTVHGVHPRPVSNRILEIGRK